MAFFTDLPIEKEQDGEEDLVQLVASLRDDILRAFVHATRVNRIAFHQQQQAVEARTNSARLERKMKELEQELAELKMDKESAKRARTNALMGDQQKQMRKMKADHQQALNAMKQRVANLEQDKSNLALSNAQLVDKNVKLDKSLERAQKKNGRIECHYMKKLELTVNHWKGSIGRCRAALLKKASELLSSVELEYDVETESSNDDGVSSDTSSISSEEEE